ncbi:MAG: HAMP domain-containing protein [Firmicutes bacterium]|nr:HAMP domain-containing protein [Bacillota bacterium]
MNRSVRGVIILVLVMAVLSCFVYAYRDDFTSPIGASEESLKYVSRVRTDVEQNLYLISDSRQTVAKISRDGVIQYKISENNGHGSFEDMVPDSKGNLYVAEITLDSNNIYVESERLIRYDPSGKIDDKIFEVVYEKDKRPLRRGYLKGLQVQDDNLFFFYVKDNVIRLNRVEYGSNLVQLFSSYELPAQTYLSEVVGTSPEAIFYTTRRGEIYRIGPNRVLELCYPMGPNASIRTLPSAIRIGADSRLYFIDGFTNEIKYLDYRLTGKPVNIIARANPDKVLGDITFSPKGVLWATQSDRAIMIDDNGIIQQTVTRGVFPFNTKMLQRMLWIALAIMFVLLLWLIKILYMDLGRRRFPLMLKQVLVFVPVLVAAMVLLTFFVYRINDANNAKKLNDQLILLNHINKNRIDIDQLQRMNSPKDYMNDDYLALLRCAVEYQVNETFGRLDEAGLNSGLYKLESDGKLYTIISYNNNVNLFRPVEIVGEYRETINGKKLTSYVANDVNGSYIGVMEPLYDRQGSMVGIYETYIFQAGFVESNQVLLKSVAKIIAGTTAVVVVIFLLMTYVVLLRIRDLRRSAMEIASGNWDERVKINSRDEIADLGDQFNIMADHIKSYIEKITRLSESYFRFVPYKFLQLLGKESILEVELGNQVEQRITIMVSQMRHFFQLSERMSPEDNFNFINAYLKRFVPIIREYGGFIDEYTGAGVIALFPNDVESALKAAVDIRKELVEYNQARREKGYEPIDFGVGIHIGTTMLGVIGEEKRLAATVISDNVNLTTSLDKLTEQFGAWILVTEETLKAVPKAKKYPHRSIGRVRIEGKDEHLNLYDVFAGDPKELRDLKKMTKGLFEEGIILYQDGAFFDARAKFLRVLQKNRMDKMAQIYFLLCDEYFRQGAPDGWNGTLSV